MALSLIHICLVDGVERTQKEAADAIGISQSYISLRTRLGFF